MVFKLVADPYIPKNGIWFCQVLFNPKGLHRISHLKENLMSATAQQQPQKSV
jgi:hypothetical protein